MKATVAATLLAVSILSGCSSPGGTDRAAAASASMAEFRDNVKGAFKQLETAIAAMNGLTAASGDLKPAYDKYVAELDKTEACAASVRADADELKAKGREFFKKWEEEIGKIKDPELQAKAKARAGERSKEYSSIELAMGTAKSKWTGLSSQLKDVKQYLSNDLTKKGVESLSGKFTQINLDATDLKKALTEVSASVEKVEADFGAQKAKPQ